MGVFGGGGEVRALGVPSWRREDSLARVEGEMNDSA